MKFHLRYTLYPILYTLLCLPAHALDPCAPDAREHYTPIVGHYGYHLLFRIEKCGVPASHILTAPTTPPIPNTITASAWRARM